MELLSRLKNKHLNKSAAITWTLKQIAPVVAKISKSLGEKTGGQMMDEFWASIAETNPDKVAILNKYWYNFANIGIRNKYNIPNIIKNIKRNNPQISGEKFYGKVKRKLVRDNSPWLQLYYDIYHEKDSLGQPMTVERLQSMPQWKRIYPELIKTYYPQGLPSGMSSSNVQNDSSLTTKARQILSQYNSEQYKDSKGRINSLCVVWESYASTLRPTEDTNDPKELIAIVNEWREYMQLVYDELKDIPAKYVTLYDQHQCDIMLRDKEHYGGIIQHINTLKRATPEERISIRYNSSYLYWGLENMVLAAKGKTIKPFDMSIDKDFAQYSKQKMDQHFSDAKRDKSSVPYADSSGQINAINLFFEKNLITQDDCNNIQDSIDFKNTISFFVQKLKSLYKQLSETYIGKIYPYNDSTISKLLSESLFGNINKQLKLTEALESIDPSLFAKVFDGAILYNCFVNMYNYMNGQGCKTITFPDASRAILPVVFNIVLNKNIFTKDACESAQDILDIEDTADYLKQLLRSTYKKIADKIPTSINSSVYQAIDDLFNNENCGNINKQIATMKQYYDSYQQVGLEDKFDINNGFNGTYLYNCITAMNNYVNDNITKVSLPDYSIYIKQLETLTNAKETKQASRLRQKVILAWGNELSEKEKAELRKKKHEENVQARRDELKNKVDFWLEKHKLTNNLPSITDKLIGWTEDKSIVSTSMGATVSGQPRITKGLSAKQVNNYLTAIKDIQLLIETMNLDELNPSLVDQIWDDIDTGEFSMPFNWLSRLKSDTSIKKNTTQRKNQMFANVNMKLIYNKYKVLIHPDWIPTFRKLVDAAHTNIKEFTDRNVHTPQIDTLANTKVVFKKVIDTLTNALQNNDVNTPEGKRTYFGIQDDLFRNEVMDAIDNIDDAINALSKFHNITYRPPRNMDTSVWDKLDMPAKTLVDQYKTVALNFETGKISPIAMAYYEHETELKNLADSFHNKMTSFNIDDPDEDKQLEAFEGREDARISGLHDIVDQINNWIQQANQVGMQFNIDPAAFAYLGNKYNSIITSLYQRIDDAENLGKLGIYSGYQLKVIFYDMVKMSLSKGVAKLTDFAIAPVDPTLELFTK